MPKAEYRSVRQPVPESSRFDSLPGKRVSEPSTFAPATHDMIDATISHNRIHGKLGYGGHSSNDPYKTHGPASKWSYEVRISELVLRFQP